MRFTNEQLPGGHLPLEQVIDLSICQEDEAVVYTTYEDRQVFCRKVCRWKIRV